MGAAAWLAYILSFFIPVFGFISFWVFAGREDDADTVGRWCLIISFIGLVAYVIAIAVGISIGASLLKSIMENILPF